WLLHFVCTHASLATPKVQAFRQWLLPEMERFRNILSQWT
ncbi:MAG: XRE family transcriptional regulator, partial [Cupriavidus sp.]|nr:XRE family transcriptional regulator [Cupriavidus sp.]